MLPSLLAVRSSGENCGSLCVDNCNGAVSPQYQPGTRIAMGGCPPDWCPVLRVEDKVSVELHRSDGSRRRGDHFCNVCVALQDLKFASLGQPQADVALRHCFSQLQEFSRKQCSAASCKNNKFFLKFTEQAFAIFNIQPSFPGKIIPQI